MTSPTLAVTAFRSTAAAQPSPQESIPMQKCACLFRWWCHPTGESAAAAEGNRCPYRIWGSGDSLLKNIGALAERVLHGQECSDIECQMIQVAAQRQWACGDIKSAAGRLNTRSQGPRA